MNLNTQNLEIGNDTIGTSGRKAALAAGLGILLMAIPAVFANFYIFEGLVVPGDAATTAANIMANEFQFRLAFLGFLVIVVLDVIAAWGLYVFFKPVNRDLSLLAAWFRLLYTAVFAVAILNLGHALQFLQGADTAATPEMGQLQAQALQALNAFSTEWDLSLLLFGLHLILVGYLVLKASAMPVWLGALVVICGLGYTFDAVTGILFPGFGITVSQVTFIGELILALWLVIKGASDKQWAKLTLEAAR